MDEYPEDTTIGGTPRDEINVNDPEVFNEPPPPEFEPQPELQDDQSPGIIERDSDLIADAEDEDPDSQSDLTGVADDDDDAVEEDDD